MLEQTLVNGLSAGLLYALIALGFALIFEVCGFFDLGQGGIYIVGFYIAYALAIFTGTPLLLAMACGVLGATALSVAAHLFLYRRLRMRVFGTVPMLVASLAVLTLLENMTALLLGPDTKSLRAGIASPVTAIGNARITAVQFVTLAATTVAYAGLGIARARTTWGRRVRAIASDRELAAIHGIPVDAVMIATVAVGSAVTALAGILSSLDTDMSPSAAFPAVLMAWVATVLGGVGRLSNTLLAGICLGLVQHVPTIWVSTAWQDPILYGGLLVILLWRPRGLASIRTAALQR